MVQLYGVCLDRLPSADLLKKMIGKEWEESWQNQHPTLQKEEAARSSLAGLFLLRFSGREGLLAYSEKGKPYLVDYKADFGITHTGEWIFCAVSSAEFGGGVGLDAESGSRLRRESIQSLSKRWLSEKEQELLGDAPDLQAFLKLWTRKEALVKWQGEGISRLHCADTVCAPEKYGISFFEYQVENIFITLCTSAKETVSNKIQFLSREEIAAWENAIL